MTIAEDGFKELSTLYNELIRKTLIAHNVKCMQFIGGEFARYYDRVEVNPNGTLNVYLLGLSTPLNKFGMDFTIDFANLLAVIENDLFFAERQGKPNGGYKVAFKFNRT